jgi:hypothetical protein
VIVPPGSLSTRWHSAHIAWAILKRWAGFPTSCASKLPTVNVKLASTRPTADLIRRGDLKMCTPTMAPQFVGALFQRRNIRCNVICRRSTQWQVRHFRVRVQGSRPAVSHRSLAISQSSRTAAHQRWLVAGRAKPRGMTRTNVSLARARARDLRNCPAQLK